MRAGSHHQIEIGGRRVDYLLVASRTARKLRLRVGLNGVELVRPANRTEKEVSAFLDQNVVWKVARELKNGPRNAASLLLGFRARKLPRLVDDIGKMLSSMCGSGGQQNWLCYGG